MFVCAVMLGGQSGEAAAAGDSKADLQEVKKRIEALEKNIADTEAAREAEAAELVRSERAVSRVQRQLRALADDRAKVEQELRLLEAERGEVEVRIASRQAELAGWLRRHYMQGGTDVAPLLSARDPNQLARDMHYMEHLGRARLDLIAALRGDLASRATLAETTTARLASIAQLEQEQAGLRDTLSKEQAQRTTAVAKLSNQLQGQKREVKTLRSDEQRLENVLAALARQAEQRAREARAREELARREAEARRLAALEAQKAEAQRAEAGRPPSVPEAGERREPSPPPPQRPRSEPAVGQIREAATPLPDGKRFAQLRGQMGFPVRGQLVGRFGAARAEGGTSWRGVFIRAQGGQDVRAVAGGSVVFSDWLRGYGNLIIVDHGDDYLTVYGNNDALFREVGDRINAGDAIASVGASGGGQETGLYFEVRHRGEPQDPMRWMRSQ